MFTEIKNKEKLLWTKTDGAISTTEDSNAFIMQHVQKIFIGGLIHSMKFLSAEAAL